MLLGESVVVQEQKSGNQLIVGINYDNSFGHVLMFGFGGILVELLKDVSFRSCPISLNDAEDMINELKMKKLIEGFRNNAPMNKVVLKKLLVDLSKFAISENIKTMDLNPILFDKDNYYIVDARIELIQ